MKRHAKKTPWLRTKLQMVFSSHLWKVRKYTGPPAHSVRKQQQQWCGPHPFCLDLTEKGCLIPCFVDWHGRYALHLIIFLPVSFSRLIVLRLNGRRIGCNMIPRIEDAEQKACETYDGKDSFQFLLFDLQMTQWHCTQMIFWKYGLILCLPGEEEFSVALLHLYQDLVTPKKEHNKPVTNWRDRWHERKAWWWIFLRFIFPSIKTFTESRRDSPHPKNREGGAENCVKQFHAGFPPHLMQSQVAGGTSWKS